jgi:HK97 family phage major capsid protein
MHKKPLRLTVGGGRRIKTKPAKPRDAPVAEGAAKPEQVFNYTEVDAPVRKIAVWTKCSDEVLADHARLGSFVNGRLQLGVELALDIQLLSGSGIAPNFTGILNFSGLQTQAKGADIQYDAIRKAITKIRKNAFVEPDAIVLHPDE